MTKKILIHLSTLFIVFQLTACTTNPYTGEQQVSRTALGAGAGAGAGAIIGAIAGGGRGAAIGAVAGGVLGGATGGYMDYANSELRKELVGTGVQVIEKDNEIYLTMASDVTFKLNSANINANFYPALGSIAKVVNKYSQMNIIISGYTDNTGSDSFNQTLSENRAKSVGAYLTAQGVKNNRIFTQGFGKRSPLVSNKTAEGRAKNRRVVITLRPR